MTPRMMESFILSELVKVIWLSEMFQMGSMPYGYAREKSVVVGSSVTVVSPDIEVLMVELCISQHVRSGHALVGQKD